MGHAGATGLFHRHPLGRTGYSATLWGLTASDGPFGYNARGAPPAQNDDGTISPTAPAGSIVFALEIVLPTLHNMFNNYPSLWGPYGFKDAFHPGLNWYDTDYLGIDQGPIILMIENYRTGKVWQRFMSYPDIQLWPAAGRLRGHDRRDGPAGGRAAAIRAAERAQSIRGLDDHPLPSGLWRGRSNSGCMTCRGTVRARAD